MHSHGIVDNVSGSQLGGKGEMPPESKYDYLSLTLTYTISTLAYPNVAPF